MKKTLRLDDGQVEVLDDIMANILKQKSPAERIKMGFGLWIAARNMLISHLGKTHPEWDSERIKKEAARRLSHGAV
jgi:hypothetical protein